MDLCSRCVVALRLSPVSTKAIDASLVLFEAICPDSKARTGGGLLPYTGVPTGVLVAGDARPALGLPGVAPETLVIDNGRIYVSAHLRSVCARLGISIQPGRPFQPTDKAVVERIFRTIGEDLLAALPGYKGPDVYSRGEHPELEAYYFVDELELSSGVPCGRNSIAEQVPVGRLIARPPSADRGDQSLLLLALAA